jgi:ABC-type multidrug transport system fused ATPase/permease subunit
MPQHVAWTCRLIQRILNQVVHLALLATVAVVVVTVVAVAATVVVIVVDAAAIAVAVVATVVTVALALSVTQSARQKQLRLWMLKKAMACQRHASVLVADWLQHKIKAPGENSLGAFALNLGWVWRSSNPAKQHLRKDASERDG